MQSKEVQKIRDLSGDEERVTKNKVQDIKLDIEKVKKEIRVKEEKANKLESVVTTIRAKTEKFDQVKSILLNLKEENESLQKALEMKESVLNQEKMLSRAAVPERKFTPKKANLLEQLSHSGEFQVKTSTIVHDSVDQEAQDLILRQNKKIEILREQLREAEQKKIDRQAALVNHLTKINSQINEQNSTPTKSHKLEGFLIKQGAFIKSWRNRFFFLNNNGLYYSRSNEKRYHTKGMIDLTDAELIVNPSNDTLCFDIKTPKRIYHLKALSEPEKERWVDGLRDLLDSNKQED